MADDASGLGDEMPTSRQAFCCRQSLGESPASKTDSGEAFIVFEVPFYNYRV